MSLSRSKTALPGPTSQVYFSQRLRLHYVDWGNDTAPPLLLVHGGRDHCRSWDWIAEALRDDYHVIAPDLRGHGDSAWSIGGNYMITDFVYDIAQLIRQRTMKPLSIIGHSLGGYISTLYTGLYPDTVSKLVVIDGIVLTPPELQAMADRPYADRLIEWIDQMRELSARQARKYKTLDEAVARMHEENPRLSMEQARALTAHAVNQNEDGTYSWKFDNYFRGRTVTSVNAKDLTSLWQRISCPTLLINGAESFIADPAANGAVKHFRNVQSVLIQGAAHWVHHDKLDEVLGLIRPFLKG
jgi:pimeloyl-ACP methyl ester carboxylesterase